MTSLDVSPAHAARDHVARYTQLRQVQRELNNRLLKHILKGDMTACAKKLGFWHRGTMVFDDEDQTAFVADVCIHDYFTGGRSAVGRYIAQAHTEPNSDEAIVLAAMQKARFSVFAIEKVFKGAGVMVRDLILGDEIVLIDMGLGGTAQEGVCLAGRILSFDGWAMTSGATAFLGQGVVGDMAVQAIRNLVGTDVADLAGPDVGAKRLRLSSVALRLAIGLNRDDEDDRDVPPQPVARLPVPPRNAPCPCGSGKKCKRCCAR